MFSISFLRNRIVVFFLAISLFLQLALAVKPGSAVAEENPQRIVFILLADNLSVSDLSEVSEAKILEKEFDGAIVSFRSGAPLFQRDTSSIYASLNSGDRIYLPESIVGDIGNADEKFLDMPASFEKVYQRLTGKEPLRPIVFPGIFRAKSFLESQHAAGIGRFGDALNKKGVLRYVFGNADLDYDHRSRSFAILLTDSKGNIGDGDVSSKLLKPVEHLPAGYGADYKQIYKKTLEAFEVSRSQKKPAVIVVYPGDFSRLEAFSSDFEEGVYKSLKKRIIREHLRFLVEVSKNLSSDDVLVFASVSPSEKDIKAGSVTGFLFIKGAGFGGGHYLYSMTTKNRGTLFLNDISVSLLRFTGASPSGFRGNQVKKGQSELKLKELSQIYAEHMNVDKARAPVLKFYVFLIVFALILSMLSLLSSIKFLPLSFTKFIIYSAVTMPIFMFVFGPLISKSPEIFVPLLFAITFGFSFYLQKLRIRLPVSIAVLLGIFTIMIAVDAPFSFFNRFSILGYSFNTGARFYGIGNEHMGIYAAGAFLSLALLGDKMARNLQKPRFSKLTYLILFSALTAFFFLWMLLPFAGANVGGAIAVLAGSVFASYHAVFRKIDKRVFVFVLVAVIILTGSFLLISIAFPSFHLAKFIFSIASSNYDSALSILSRKIQLNLKLLWFTVWNKYLIAIIVSLLVIITNPQDVLRRFFKKDAWGESLLTGTGFGALAAFVFNDSGVVAAATMLIYPMMIFVCELVEITTGEGGA